VNLVSDDQEHNDHNRKQTDDFSAHIKSVQ